ncbi:MAG: cytochrome C [Nitrospinota bacterium]
MNNRTFGIVVTSIVFIVLSAPIIYTAAGNGLFAKPPAPKLTLPANATECVEPTDWMRANHQELLMHERKVAVREGIRTVKHSLGNCKTCHTKREEFCDSCHQYTGIKLECFDCHYQP